MTGEPEFMIDGKDFISRITGEDIAEVDIWTYFPRNYAGRDHYTPGDITTQINMEYGEVDYLHETSIKQIVDYHIDGCTCCCGVGVFYGDEAVDTRALVQELRAQADRLEALCVDVEPTETEHKQHRGE